MTLKVPRHRISRQRVLWSTDQAKVSYLKASVSSLRYQAKGLELKGLKLNLSVSIDREPRIASEQSTAENINLNPKAKDPIDSSNKSQAKDSNLMLQVCR